MACRGVFMAGSQCGGFLYANKALSCFAHDLLAPVDLPDIVALPAMAGPMRPFYKYIDPSNVTYSSTPVPGSAAIATRWPSANIPSSAVLSNFPTATSGECAP